VVYFKVRSLGDIRAQVLTLLDKYPLQGVKLLNYNDFKKGADIMESKQHLTSKGLLEILSIKRKMNTLTEC
jgi:hypothetical protein